MTVIDASALVEYLSGAALAGEVRERIDGTSSWLWAPHLVDAEVGHALRRGVRLGEVQGKAAQQALLKLRDLRLMRIDHQWLVARAWELRDNVSFYDGLYVALAEELKAPLVTLDARLAGAPGLTIEVDVVKAA